MIGRPVLAATLTMPHKRVLIALAGIAVFSIVYAANCELAHDIDSEIAQAERTFCLNLGVQAGARYDSCIHEASRLLRQEQEIRSAEF
jgi:hypothetical protein